MPGPAYDPGPWNAPDAAATNNCYNYATNQQYKPDAAGILPAPSEPGRSKGITIGVIVGYDPSRSQPLGEPGASDSLVLIPSAVHITCAGLKTACGLDGLSEPTDGKCPAECWMIAYYVKPAQKVGMFWISADYHFVRQDADGKWSHKPGSSTVNRNQWKDKPGAAGAYDGPEITDPATANVGPGFAFCGYFCVCPNKVVIAMREAPDGGRGDASAVVYRPGTSSFAASTLALLEGTSFSALVERWRAGVRGEWQPGFGPGALHYRFDVGAERRATRASILVSAHSVTLWQDGARHFVDRGGTVVRFVEAWFESRETRPGAPGPQRPGGLPPPRPA